MSFILVSTAILVLLTIGTGVFYIYNNMEGGKKKLKGILRTNLFVFLPLLIAAVVIMVPQAINAETGEAAGGLLSSSQGLGFISAALATGIATLGAGYAVAVVGSAALGAVSEDSSLLGKTLIFVGLAEGIAIYGLIVSIMILGRL
ncbi:MULTISPECIES: ATP synthase subunit C [Gudongella]|jgi:V/A-type H+-transporting ATPase subunit K|uniref:ATP synthase subunit C n=1 Tax=Gudongella oleilytica TaxID=1582259 RepID=UPI000ED6BCA6|nr:ATP synthase subunit C [Gudongella oleilytica]MDY0257181.1 ATP synthase subunit C [Gudongella oleilytica]HCO18188.1 ATPase [Tissierellales bacterium]HMM69834.1 ATP synthase subunit C [Gudongella oleilytica]